MYKLAVNKDFIAHHFLIGGDWGPENRKHSHHYRLEVQLKGNSLDEHGYLVDIAEVKDRLEAITAGYQDRTLNDLPEFRGINPSIENLARITCQTLRRTLPRAAEQSLKVRVWEDDSAWVTYRED